MICGAIVRELERGSESGLDLVHRCEGEETHTSDHHCRHFSWSQVPDEVRPFCGDVSPNTGAKCRFPSGHGGGHSNGVVIWYSPLPVPRRWPELDTTPLREAIDVLRRFLEELER